MKNVKRYAASAILAGALAAPALASSASAKPIFTGGLVNVTVTDVIDGDVLSYNRVGLGVAAGIAANVCGLRVAAVIADIRDGGPVSCTSTASDQVVRIVQG